MHIAVSTSALQIIRYIRSQGLSQTGIAFPEVEEPAPVIQLPTANDQLRIDMPVSSCRDDLFDMTLLDAHFPFDACIANKNIDCPISDESTLHSFRKCIKLGVFDIKRRAYRKTLRTTLLRKDLPAKALIWISSACCIASPEFTVIQLAAQLDKISLAQLIMELTGFYSLPPTNTSTSSHARQNDERTVYQIPPVTTLVRIRDCARHIRMMRGKRTLDAALGIALERSASPAESILAIMFRLPLEQGGYGMGTPLLNPQVDVPEAQREFVSQKCYYPDVFFPDCLADLEYESTSFHLDPMTANWTQGELKIWRAQKMHKAEKDRMRAREMEALGLRVIPVMWNDLLIRGGLDRVAWALARRMEDMQLLNAEDYMRQLDSFDLCMARESVIETLLEW